MKSTKRGLTIIETLMGIMLMVVIMGSIIGYLIVVYRYFNDGIAMAKSQAVARTVMEEISRPTRHGKSFTISDNGDSLTVERTDGSFDVYSLQGNIIQKNGIGIGTDIYQVEATDVFEEDIDNKDMVIVNFIVRNEGFVGHDKEMYVSTKILLRN